MMTINERITILRKQYLGLRQNSFCERLGVTPAAISKIEKGDRGVSNQMLYSICREFDVNPAWLEDGIEPIFLSKQKKDAVTDIIDVLENMPEDIRDKFKDVLIYLADEYKKISR